MMETKRRSIAKTLSWRLIATVVTASVAYLMTGETQLAIEIGIIDTTVKLLAYYGHERMWLRIPYGMRKFTDYQI